MPQPINMATQAQNEIMNDILSYVTFKRTYARKLEGSNKTESFQQTIDRVIQGCQEQMKCNFSPEEVVKVKKYMLERKISTAGRFLWQSGTKTVEERGLLSLQNCAAVIIDSPIKPFEDLFTLLLLGAGVGYRFTDDVTQDIPKIQSAEIVHQRTKDADFIIPDSREGWVKLLGKVLKSHFYSGKGFSYSTILLRERGEEIKTFGGVSSGYMSLVEGMKDINNLLNANVGKKPSQCVLLDIGNIIARIVVSGNIRRSALLGVGDLHDEEFMLAKDWHRGDIPNWRAFSNNSVICNDIAQLPESFWDNFKNTGEVYGLLNLRLMQSCGRTGETLYPDPDVALTNPCVEITLNNYETCCLAEIFLPRIESYDELLESATFLYRICKHSLTLPCHIKKIDDIIHKNYRMGLGITGYLQCTEEQKCWLPYLYNDLREYDRLYSEENGLPVSIKLTTVKPSGTLSLIGGLVCSGCHPAYSRYYIRRIRFQSDSPLVAGLQKLGYKWEYVQNFDGTKDHNTMCIEFPVKAPDNAVLANETTAIEQLEVVKRLQREYADNSVSVSVYYRTEEVEGIRKWMLENYNDSIKSVSFLLHSEHGFCQSPLEEITREKYHMICDNLKKDVHCSEDFDNFFSKQEKELALQSEAECSSGACPIR
jgi:adenosylcobalamin-dependent ribonucleoside-triphosphate reductase